MCKINTFFSLLTEKKEIASNPQNLELSHRLEKQTRGLFACFILGLLYHSSRIYTKFGTIIKLPTPCVESDIWTSNINVTVSNFATSIFVWAFWPKREKKKKVHTTSDEEDASEEKNKKSVISSIGSEK